MERLLRWLGIKLLVKSCMRKAPDWSEARKVYILHRGAFYIALVGQQPGSSYGAPGRRNFVLMGECIQYMIGRTVLRGPGAWFPATGVIQVKPGPGVSWCWYLQIGR